MDTLLIGNKQPSFYRILVVDDDVSIAELVAMKLESSGFQVMTAHSGEDALDLIGRRGLPHLAIVDVVLPGMDGFEFCETVQSYADLPVVMLSAVDREETIIRGIEYFAEDYITKPFSPRELVVRVRRVLRRMGDYAYAMAPVVELDDRLAVDFVHQKAIVAGKPVSLTPTETKILYVLTRNAGRTVTSDFLLRRVWPLEEIYEDTLRVHVHRLRHKIEANPSKPAYIRTERGLGYRFQAN